jgi:hypothetical protein
LTEKRIRVPLQLSPSIKQELFVLKHIFYYLILTMCLTALSACGSSESTTGTSGQTAKSVAILSISLTGVLPPATAISGADFTINLPANVIPKITNGSVDTEVVVTSGIFAGTTLSPVSVYSATESSLRVILPCSVLTGITQVGEAATITLLLSNNATPSATSFSVSSPVVFDVATNSSISSLGIAITNVTLQ